MTRERIALGTAAVLAVVVLAFLLFPSSSCAGTTVTPSVRVTPSAPSVRVTPSVSARPTYTPSVKSATPASVRSYTPPAPKYAGTGRGASYTPPSVLPKPPQSYPSSVPSRAFSTRCSCYWANPASSYYWLFLATYGSNGDSGNDNVSWGEVAVIFGGTIAFVLLIFGGMAWADRRY